MKNLKPVIFVQGDSQFYRPNYYAQQILMKALSDGITDPKELMRVAGLNRVVDVYRSLDKLAIRKEYHEALARNGITFDYIVKGIKGVADDARSDSVRLHGLQTLLRSIGLEKYEQQDDSGKTWEEIILKAIDKEDEDKDSMDVIEGKIEEYKVDAPQIPNEEKEDRKRERKIGKGLYE